MSNIHKHEVVRRNTFIDNTSFLLSSVFGLLPKPFCRDNDITEIKDNLNNYLRFIIAVKTNAESHRMMFMVSDKMQKLQLINTPIMSDIFDEIFLPKDIKENEKKLSLRMNFWYNVAAIYMFSFLDNIDCVGDSIIYNDLPVEISGSECLAYFSCETVSAVIGMSKKSKSPGNGLLYVGMLS